MDKEAQEKVAEYLYKNFTVDGAKSMLFWSGVRDSLRQRLLKDARQILSLVLPKDKPPLLSDEEIWVATDYEPNKGEPLTLQDGRKVAQAQREAGIKWYSQH